MKKSVITALTAAMVITLSSITAFAAPSATVPVAETPAVGTAVEAVASPEAYDAATTVSTGYKETAVSATTVKSASVATQNIILNNLDKLGDPAIAQAAADPKKTVSAIVRTVVDVTPAGATKNAAGNYEFTLSCNYIGTGRVYVLHYLEKSKSWVLLVLKAATKGAVTIESATLSPFAVVELNVASVTAPATSPKTGETLPAALMFIMIGAVGAVVCTKKVLA